MPESFLYQYAVGGFVFAVGIYCGFRTGMFSWCDPQGRRRLFLMVSGLLFFATLQGLFVWLGK